MAAWQWLTLGLVLIAAEMLVPGTFYCLLVGLAAVTVGVLLAAGVPLSLTAQVLLAAGLAVALVVLVQGPLQRRLGRSHWGTQDPAGIEIDGECGVALGDLTPDVPGQVELRGSVWMARTESQPVAQGQRCRVVRHDGLTLWVTPER